MHKRSSSQAPAMAGELIKGAIVGAAASLLLIILFAVVIWQQWLTTDSISAVNTGIKVVSAALAGIVGARRCSSRAWLYGALSGLIYAVLAFAVFSILSDSFTFTLMAVADIGIGLLSGMLAAMIYAAVK